MYIKLKTHLAFFYEQRRDVGEDSACYQSGYRGSTRVSSQHVQIATGHQNSGKSTAGLRADPRDIFYFSNIIENVMKLPHNLNFKNNFLYFGKICQTPS